MKRTLRRIAAVPLLMAALLLGACGEAPSDEHEIDDPVTLQEIEGTELTSVTMTQQAAERLGIQTAPVESSGEGTVVPSAAVLVDPYGDFWVYTSLEPLVFVRHQITIDYEEGDQAFLSDGPPAGTQVVTVGVSEVYGSEYEVGH